MFQSAKDAAELTPTTSNQAALCAGAGDARAIAAADPVAAQRQLAELLARPETLLPIERLLALVELKEVEQTADTPGRKQANARRSAARRLA